MKIITQSFVLIFLLIFPFFGCESDEETLPNGFVYVKDEIPNVISEIRYFGNHNFVGRPIIGYEKEVAILSLEATKALKNVQSELNEQGLGIKIFDTYRPQRSVSYFEVWAKDLNDTIAKQEFYPDVDKKNLFKLGYIAAKSGHTRGSTIDLTIVNLKTNQELDMGSTYDFFGEISHHNTQLITNRQKSNREVLRQIMLKHGFKDYPEEWWHYTLLNEPFPDIYFDFLVK